MLTSKPKADWDTRSWALGLLLGNLAGFLLFLGGNPASRRFIETAFPYTAFGYYTGDLLQVFGSVCGGLIFSAVLTLTAKRRYFLLGVLPISCFTVWYATGNMISDSKAFSVNIVFTFFAFVLLCWGAVCLPSALFRLWYTRRRSVSSLPASVAVNPLRRWRSLYALLLPLAALALLGWYNFRHPPHGNVDVEIRWASNKEAQVPLVVKHGGIFVTATLSGEEQLCQIDTGFDAVMWSRDLHLSGSLLGEQGETCNAVNDCIASDTIKLPRVQLGGFQITNLPTRRLDVDTVPFSPSGSSHTGDYAVLGNSVFSLTVLTVDYRNKLLIIHPPSYDFQKAARHPGNRVMQMGWSYHNDDTPTEQQVFGWPAVRASVNGRSFWCMLDTGWEGPDLGLSEELVHQVPSLEKLPRKSVSFSSGFSDSSALQVPQLEFKVPSLSPADAPPLLLKSVGTLVKSSAGGEGIVGTYLMERYRITIDYQRRRVLLEPYARDVPGKKQEKRRPVAKSTAL